MTTITDVRARQILDSRGNPTVEVELTAGEHTARAAVPSGASTGVHEALELRDGDQAVYGGKGVTKAVAHVTGPLAEAVRGLDPTDQGAVDAALLAADGTDNKSQYGANAILGISLAAARLGAMVKGVALWEHIQQLYGVDTPTLPRPMMNILNGGAHADSGLAIQEFMVFPKLGNFADNLRAGAEIFHVLKRKLSAAGYAVGVGDEGGFAPHIPTVDEALKFIMEAIEEAGYSAGEEIELALDAAASEFYAGGKYTVDGRTLTAAELVDFYLDLMKRYPITSIEDSHHEDDLAGWQQMRAATADMGLQLVGDDLLVTNVNRLKMGIEQGLANSILVKVNQIGSLTETLAAMRMAHAEGWTTVISHRSGETEDTFIADLAVGTAAGQIKTGSLCRSERVAKYNQLLRIGESL